MANFYSRYLQELPGITITDVHIIAKWTSRAQSPLSDKGFKFYASSFIHNYEGTFVAFANSPR